MTRRGFADPFRLLAWASVAVAMFSVLIPVYTNEGCSRPRAPYCRSNLRQLTTGLLMYSQDYDDQSAPASGWEECLDPYIKNRYVYVCPQRPDTLHAYAYNRLLDRRPTKEIRDAAQAPVFFDSALGSAGGADRLQSFVRPHDGRGMIAFADAHVEAMRKTPRADAGLAPPSEHR